MTTIRYVHGNLLAAPEPMIVHGCNAQGVMGSGVAKAIRDRYPKAYEDYRAHYQRNGLSLGQVIWSDNEPHIVANAITQQFYGGEPGVRYCCYEGIAVALKEINDVARAGNIPAVAMPLIGAGLAQGSWRIISTIIEITALDFEPVVYLIDGVMPQS
jgi:O-acetyl-ADP-ribose deacetylase (regulator of RNase III)